VLDYHVMATMNPNGTAPPSRPRDPDFYAGYTRFEIECEVSRYSELCSTNIKLTQANAVRPIPQQPPLHPTPRPEQIPRRPGFHRLPGVSGLLPALELLQQEQFRKDAVTPALIEAMALEGFEAATAGTQV